MVHHTPKVQPSSIVNIAISTHTQRLKTCSTSSYTSSWRSNANYSHVRCVILEISTSYERRIRFAGRRKSKSCANKG
eukprot:10024277-Ditylum_brightwellii.AAC.1